MPLVINPLGAETHTYQHANKRNFKKPGICWPVADMHWFLEITFVQYGDKCCNNPVALYMQPKLLNY